MKLLKSFLFIFPFALTGTLDAASAAYAEDEETEIGYETIVSELSRVKTRGRDLSEDEDDLFDTVKIHTGVGLMQSLVRVRSAGGEIEGFLRGVQATLGIDLFSRNWFAEGAIRSFSEEPMEQAKIQLREFDLKIVYRSNPYNLFGFRGGAGLAARNLKLIEAGTTSNFSTPASVLLTGVDINISSKLSLGGEVSYRTAMVSDSADRNSFDIAVKIDAHF